MPYVIADNAHGLYIRQLTTGGGIFWTGNKNQAHRFTTQAEAQAVIDGRRVKNIPMTVEEVPDAPASRKVTGGKP